MSDVPLTDEELALMRREWEAIEVMPGSAKKAHLLVNLGYRFPRMLDEIERLRAEVEELRHRTAPE